MRKLSARQQKLLRELYKESGLINVDDTRGLSNRELECINIAHDANPHETFYQNANRFLWDLHWEVV